MSTAADAFQLSKRAQQLKPSSTLAVTARVNALKAQGADIIGFGAGQPDFDTPENIKRAAIDALVAGKTKYVATAGDPEARRVIAEKLRSENDIECDASHVVITVGAKHALYMTLQVLVDPGDEVILPTPCWVSYRPMAELAGGTVVELPGAMDNDFKITPEQLEAAITPRTRAILLNTPSNPCGTTYSPDELRALAEVLAKHERVFIITDEIYEKFTYGEAAHLSLGSIDSIAERTVTINSLSKSFAMTGWRVGYLCAPGHDGAIAQAIPQLQDQMTSNITSFCYPSVAEALTNSADSVATMRAAFAERAQIMWKRVAAWPSVRVAQPTGAFYVFPDVSAHFGSTSPGGVTIDSALAFASALLDEAGVAVVPGEDFGECARNHVRLSFACSAESIEKGTDRIAGWISQLT